MQQPAASSFMAQRPPKRRLPSALVVDPIQQPSGPQHTTTAASQPPKKQRPAFKQAPLVTLIQPVRRSVFQFPRIQQLLGELPVCRYEFPAGSELKDDQDDLVSALRHASDTKRLLLPSFTCAYEAQLLREAGEFHIGGRLVAFPHCRFGERCVGRATGPHAITGLDPEHGGVTLMALLFEGELATLLCTGTIDLQGNQRPCLLCYRHLLCDFLFSLQPRHSAPMGSTCIQIYSNLQVRVCVCARAGCSLVIDR
jgi:hypothetical protein